MCSAKHETQLHFQAIHIMLKRLKGLALRTGSSREHLVPREASDTAALPHARQT